MKSFLLRFILSASFIYASIHKIINPQIFSQQIAAYELLPNFLIHPTAYSLPFLELFAGCALWHQSTRKPALYWLLLMTISFIFAISYALLTHKNINCGCFHTEQPISYLNLILDAFYLYIIIALLKHERPIPTIQDQTL